MITMQFVYGFLIGGVLCGIACLLIGRKHPKIADAVAAEANKIAGK